MDIELLKQHVAQLGRRNLILNIERAIALEGIDVGAQSCPVQHHYAHQSYGREMFLPAGLVVVGKIHKYAHMNVLSMGHVVVFTEQDGVQELKAPCTFVSKPGTKRVVLVLEDALWTTIHVTDKTDLAEIEAEVIATAFQEIPLCHGTSQEPPQSQLVRPCSVRRTTAATKLKRRTHKVRQKVMR